MSDLIVASLTVLLPTWCICAAFAAWGAHSWSLRLSKILKISALFWVVILTAAFVVFIALTANCTGNFLYGFGTCPGIGLTGTAADQISGVALLAYGLGILFGAALLVLAGVWEFVVRRREGSG